MHDRHRLTSKPFGYFSAPRKPAAFMPVPVLSRRKVSRPERKDCQIKRAQSVHDVRASDEGLDP
jgi:hypothetical protein